MHEALKQRQKELDNKKKGEAKLEVEEKPVDTLLPSADRGIVHYFDNLYMHKSLCDTVRNLRTIVGSV